MILPSTPETPWEITDLETLVAPGLSAQIFHDFYPEGRQGGITLIQKDDRIAANGDVRLETTPGQWSSLPEFNKRSVDKETHCITAHASFKDPPFDYQIRVIPNGNDLLFKVDLNEPLPPAFTGKACFNLELFPVRLFGKSWQMDDKMGLFPHQHNGPVSTEAGIPVIHPMAKGRKLTILPERPGHSCTITSHNQDIILIDGRESVANGWFIVSCLLQPGKTKNVLSWRISMPIDENYRKTPLIGFSQVGYHPNQPKKAVLECDRQTTEFSQVTLEKIEGAGTIKSIPVETIKWGSFLRYQYALADFSQITDPGLYRLKYEDQTTPVFRIDPTIYDEGVWQPTMETYMPVQMCHMTVHDGYRLWHGCCHLDDGIQAPCDHIHFDGYHQYAATETEYSPGQYIPGMDRGGWHDAGDFDLATGSQAITTYTLALIRETFGIETDQTKIDFEKREVLLHQPDGTPDVLQQVRHGVEFLLQAYRNSGHSYAGVIAGSHSQYVHLGDAATMTENDQEKIASASPEAQQEMVRNPGRLDPRWIFTNHDSALEYMVTATLAIAARVLKDTYPQLAANCQHQAEKTWAYEADNEPVLQPAAYIPKNFYGQKALASIELYRTTGKLSYLNALIPDLNELIKDIRFIGWQLADVLDEFEDEKFRNALMNALRELAENTKKALAENPYNVMWEPHIWGIGWQIQRFALHQYFLHKSLPELFARDPVFDVVNYVLGCHPASNTSLVSGVGSQSLMVAYGTNRAEWSNIPGGMVSGPNLIRPDFPEMKEPYPYIWQQTEYVMSGATSYMFCILAARDLLQQ